MSESLFRVARWLSVTMFMVIFLFSYFHLPQLLVFIAIPVFILSFVYIVFYKCSSCNKSFSSTKGFVSICWPYTNSCRNCGEKLGNTNEPNI